MITTILEHEIEFNWREGKETELDESDIKHIEDCIKDGCNQGELCQIVSEEDEVEKFGWWKIKTKDEDKLKEMQKSERLMCVINDIDGLLDQIDTLVMNTRSDKELCIGRELVEQNMEGIDNVVAIIKTKIEEAKDSSLDKRN